MKKVLTIVFIFFIAFGLYAQTIDTSLLDLSRAKVSIAGPESVYIRSIYYNGNQLSILLKYNGTNGATVYGPYYEKDKLLQDWYKLDYAKLNITGQNEITVSGIILGNQAYSGILKWAGGSTLVVDRYWKSSMPETNETRIANLKKEMLAMKDKYEYQISSLKNQVATLKASAASKKLAQKPAQAMVTKKKPEKSVLTGFSNGKAIYGSWDVTYNSVEQKNTSLKFAKYSIPIYQSQDMTSYSFTAKAKSNTGWVGYGLHFFVSGEKTAKGYGFGKSYLVWLTRDPGSYQTDSTYLQLYESYNDIKMIQLTSMLLPYAITSPLTTEVVYDRSAGNIDVSVNGERLLSYHLSSPIYSGNKIALRTLGGPVEFTNLDVKVK